MRRLALRHCGAVTDAAVRAVAVRCKQMQVCRGCVPGVGQRVNVLQAEAYMTDRASLIELQCGVVVFWVWVGGWGWGWGGGQR